MDGHHQVPDYTAVPSVVFTVPPLAAVGLGEQLAHERGKKVRIIQQDTAGWYSSRRLGESCSAHKVLVDDTSGRIEGAHLLGPMAEETITLFALAMRAGLTVSQVKDVLFAYPTHAADPPYML